MKKIRKHIIAWTAYLLFLWIFAAIKSNLKADFLTFFVKNLLLIGVFYYSVNIVFTFFFQRSRVLGFFYLLIGIAIYLIIRYYLLYILLPHFGKPIFDPYKVNTFYTDGIFLFISYSVYGLLFWYATNYIKSERKLYTSEKEKLQLQNQNLLLQNDNIMMENNFLRAQINPHFLYNCLNFFYSETLEKHPYVADGILMLSDIMRYSLKDYSHNNGLTELSEEIEHIENVVNIHQMRFVGSLHIKIKVEGHPEGKLIAPMVLITLVENVFKHGDLHDSNHPAIIHCKIDEAKKNILLSTFNKKKTGSREPSTGIGLANIEQRLQSLYPDSFNIHTFEDDFRYKKEIVVPYV